MARPSAPPLPPSPVMTTMIGTLEDGHLAQVQGDGLGDAALLGLDAGIGRRRVDEDDDRPAELVGHLHRAQRLAIALRPRVAEVALHLLLHVAALLVAADQDRRAVVAGEAADDGAVVGEAPIAVQLDELGEQPLDVVEQVGPLGMARHQHALPRRQAPVDLAADLIDAAAQAFDLAVADVGLRQHARAPRSP